MSVRHAIDVAREPMRANDLGLSILYDIGQIANEQGLGSDIDLKQSLGFAVYFGQVVRVSLGRRLDRSFDNNPRFYVRFTQAF